MKLQTPLLPKLNVAMSPHSHASSRSQFQEKNTQKPIGDYKYTSMVSHRGTVLSFAMTNKGRIDYVVLDLSIGDQTQAMDVENWTDPATELTFPNELSRSGFGLIKNYQMPPRGRANEELTEENLQVKAQIDPFHSSTGKLTATAPFQVLSDGKYIYVFRQALPGSDPLVDQPDVHYPMAQASYGENSYFKPKEAYKLKNKIEREKQEMEAYFNRFNVSKSSDKLNAAMAGTHAQQLLNLVPAYGPVLNAVLNQYLGMAVTQLAYDGTELEKQIAKMVSQRNLANTYVWTMEGGFFSESTQVTETQQEVYNQSFGFSVGGDRGFQYEASGGIGFEQKTLFGSGSSLTMTRSKTKSSSTAFGLEVSVDIPTSPRYKYDGTTRNAISIPAGTVDAYRFMSFYLEPKVDNYEDLFTKVIDSKWLEESPDPNARALREARNDIAKPFCWRIMHRVTFVSRILPEFTTEAPPSLEKSMRAQNIESNYMLIKLFEPYISKIKKANLFFNEIGRIIKQEPEFKAFKAYESEIKAYLGLYYGIE